MRLLSLFLIGAILEIGVLIMVGQTIGVLYTVGWLVLDVLVGSWIVRSVGRRTLREVAEAAKLGRPPAQGLSNGVLLAAGGVGVLLPGFVSDAIGLVLLLPPTRFLLRRWLIRHAERRSAEFAEKLRHAQLEAERHQAGEAVGGSVIDGEVVDSDAKDTKDDVPPT